jgi:hypothetical protein
MHFLVDSGIDLSFRTFHASAANSWYPPSQLVLVPHENESTRGGEYAIFFEVMIRLLAQRDLALTAIVCNICPSQVTAVHAYQNQMVQGANKSCLLCSICVESRERHQSINDIRLFER